MASPKQHSERVRKIQGGVSGFDLITADFVLKEGYLPNGKTEKLYESSRNLGLFLAIGGRGRVEQVRQVEDDVHLEA